MKTLYDCASTPINAHVIIPIDSSGSVSDDNFKKIGAALEEVIILSKKAVAEAILSFTCKACDLYNVRIKKMNENHKPSGLTLYKMKEKFGKDYTGGLPLYKFEIKYGRKYARIYAVSTSNCIHAFIDLATGDIYKPASRNAPAKHVRGNVLSDENGMESLDSCGFVRYLK